MPRVHFQLIVTVEDESGAVSQPINIDKRWVSPAAIPAGADQRGYSVNNSSFQALTAPTGARLAIIELDSTMDDMTLKGVTGDTGIDASPTSNPLGLPAVIPLGDSPSIGITNGSGVTQVIPVTML